MSNDVTEATDPMAEPAGPEAAAATESVDSTSAEVETDVDRREAEADRTDEAGAASAADADDEEADEATEEGDTGVASRGATGDRRRQLEREGEVAADFLETLLDICDLDGDLDVDIDGDRAAVAIVDSDEGRVPRRLVGPDGQVLEAVQELTRLAVQSVTGERSRLMLDIAGHRAERRATLVDLAKSAIEEVRASGERRELSPMSAFERKVVHDEVLAAGLVSESEGAEPRRFVVILPR
jgi:spoIIIJ-associated protein